MKRIRNLGLAVLAALALTASASTASASASGFEADAYPSAVSGWQVEAGEEPFTLSTNWLSSIPCEAVPFSSELSFASLSLEGNTGGAPTCWGSANVPFEMNGCDFAFHPGAETGTGKFAGTYDIGPPGCGPISLTVYKCRFTIGSQSGLAASYENTGAGDGAKVLINSQASITYTQEKTTFSGCANGTYTGTYTGAWHAVASQGGAPEGMRVSNQIPTLVGFEGKESEIEGEQPRFESSLYPASLAGEEEYGATLTVPGYGNGKLVCEDVTFAGEVSGPATQLALAPQYSGCTFGGAFTAKVSTNGCEYVFNVLNVGPPYAGDVDIVCPEGKAIEIMRYVGGILKCTISIASQAGLSGVSFANGKSGDQVSMGLGLSGIAYHLEKGTGVASCTTGDAKDATYNSTTIVRGYH